jgi:cation transport protein ChaC
MAQDDLWIFGYGSLMWNPGFDPVERRLARLKDYARTFCMWSIHHRGTPEEPGLVLALDEHPGAGCEGLAFRVAPEQADETMTYLRERELVSSAYLERIVTLRLEDGREVRSVAYVVDRNHVQYCGGLGLEEQARVIARSTGGRGPNDEYLYNTAGHLAALGIADEELSWLARRVAALKG